MTQMLLQHCFSIFKNSLLGAEFLWTNKSIPFMVLRRLMLGITNARLQAVREVLGQFYLRLWILSLMKVDSFHVCSPNYWSITVCGRGGNHCVLQGAIHMIPEWLRIYLHIFLCICLLEFIPKKNISFLYKSSSSWFSFPMKLSFRYEIHYCIM